MIPYFVAKTLSKAMETSAAKYLTNSIKDKKGLDFLTRTFQFYIILDFRTTKIHNVEEIVELGLVITKTNYLGALYTYSTFVKPTILKRVSNDSQVRHGITYNSQNPDFSKVLDLLTSKISFIANILEYSLIVVPDRCIMESIFPGQCEIIQRLNGLFPPSKNMDVFQQWCCLRDMYGIVRDMAINTQNYTIETFNKEYYNTYSGLVGIYSRCVDRANALIPLMKMYSFILQRNLFPTTIMSIPSIQNEKIYSAIPHYFRFRNFYLSLPIDSTELVSGRYANKFDRDFVYTGSDEEEGMEATTKLFPHIAPTNEMGEFHCSLCSKRWAFKTPEEADKHIQEHKNENPTELTDVSTV